MNCLTDALERLVKEKAFLRQTFNYENEKLMIRVHEVLPPEIEFYAIAEEKFPDLEKKLIKQTHDIFLKSSVRLSLIQLIDTNYCIALFNIHHIIMDGTSLDHFMLDLNKLLKGELIEPEDVDDYFLKLKQETPLQTVEGNSSIEDYVKEIDELFSKINFSFASEEEVNTHYTGILPELLFQKLREFSRKKSISIFNLLLLAQSVFLSKLFNQDMDLLNYPIDVRRDKHIDGCFVNLIAYPLKLGVDDDYLSLIDRLNSRFIFFKQLAKTCVNHLSNISFIPNFAVSNLAKPLDLIIDNEPKQAKSYAQLASSTLSIKYQERAGRLYFTCDITEGLLPDTLANTLIERFFNYLNKLLTDPVSPLSTTSLLFEDEEKQLLYDFNKTQTSYPKDKTIQQLFEEQVENNPNQIALVYADYKLSYAELNKQANQLAHYLFNHYQLKSDDILALCFDRTPEFIITMLAVLKTGSAYVSLDSNFHSERTFYILSDAKTKIVLTMSQFIDKVTNLTNTLGEIQVIAVDEAKFKDELQQQLSINIISDTDSSDLAHLIYTSGTTGSPKGVMIEHQNVVSLVKNVSYIDIKTSDTFALFSDITFDASTFEIWGALLNGAALFIPYDRLELLSDTKKLHKVLVKNQVTILWLTKTLFDQLFFLDETLFGELRYLLVGGESLNKSLMSKLSASVYRPAHLINGYGPTENTTFSCAYEIHYERLDNLHTVPIGVPLSNRSAYVLDLHLNVLPIGVVGELYVGGAGLARGYLNKYELTSQKFIFNPFQTKEEKEQYLNSKLYKTGDLARILPDGNIECLGRNDFQVKIRGYRIELSEIESKLINHPEINQVVIIENKFINPHEQTAPYLIAYYVAETPINELELRNFLLTSLPEYMLPRVFVHLTEFPQTSSGKLDRKLLPPPVSIEVEDELKPRNEQERLISAAFSEVLGLNQISIKDDFFHIGGNSIKAIALAARLQAQFKISVADIFNKRTPEKIANNILYSKNDLNYQLEKIKLHFQHRENEKLYEEEKEKLSHYSKTIPKEKIQFNKKPISNILLTGVTGYLGANLLHHFLNGTHYTVFLSVRAASKEEAFERVNQKYQFYFDKTLEEVDESRFFVLSSDLEKPNLGLNQEEYDVLVNSIDSIVHAAALTKHYGEYDKFYSANVQATIHLLELSQQTGLKDFHHISTVSVLDNSCDNQEFLTEDDVITKLDKQSNIYIKTKHEAEEQVLKFKKKGVNANIYRVGNLAFIFNNLRTQENLDDNAFFSRMKCLVKLNAIAKEIGIEEISPVDFTAQAIIKILDKQELSRGTYHVFNPNLCDITAFFSQSKSAEILSINDFLDLLARNLETPNEQTNLIMRYLLHQGWLDGEHRAQVAHHVLQQRTNAILEQLDFQWPIITKDTFWALIEKSNLS